MPLSDKMQDLQDYREAKQAYDEFVASEEEPVKWEDMKKELNL